VVPWGFFYFPYIVGWVLAMLASQIHHRQKKQKQKPKACSHLPNYWESGISGSAKRDPLVSCGQQ